MFPADRLPTTIAVEYDIPSGRANKVFPDAYQARRFYAAKFRQGQNPKVKAAQENDTMAKTNTASKTPATKTTTKVETNGVAGRTKKEGLRDPQVRILQYLLKSKTPQNRKVIAEKAPADLAMLNSYLGSHDEAIRKVNDTKNFPCLLTLKAVKAEVILGDTGREVTHYQITATGKQLLEKALKAAK